MGRLQQTPRRRRWVSFAAAGLFVAAIPGIETPVADAARAGDLAQVQALLRDGADVNAAHGDGMSALHWAAVGNHADMVEVLLYAGAHANSTTRLGGYTALHLAAREGHANAVGALVSGGAEPDVPNGLGATALHFAAESGVTESLDVLLAAETPVDILQPSTGQTPLMWAVAAGRIEAARRLLEAGADPIKTTNVVDYVAVAASDREHRRLRTQLLQAQIAARGLAPEVQEEPDLADGSAAQLNSQEEGEQRTAREEAAPRQERPDSASAETTGSAAPAEEADSAAANEDTAERAVEGEDEQPIIGATQAERLQDEGRAPRPEQDEDAPRPKSFTDLVAKQGGFTPLHFAAREGHREIARLLLAHGAGVNQPTEGDGSSPMLVAIINGNYDLAADLLAEGADPNLTSLAGATPVFATLNNRWAPKALYPQPTAFKQQQLSYLELLEQLLGAGADPNARLADHLWYTSFNFDLLGVNFTGATPFWRAAYATDVAAMRLLVSYGADHQTPTTKAPVRRRRGEAAEDKSGLPPVPVGGPAVPPLHAASGVGYGAGFAGNSHRHVPEGWLPAVRYLVEELGHDVNVRDHDGYSAVHHAAARGDNELIMYLVEQGADVTFQSRNGQTTVDLANGPQQRIQPFPETIALLESLGAINNHNCKSC